ncbi:FecR domain-containing protein [Maridesulfovibrio hydrothermalis]|uniref:FecR protein domain-containing protein n=1 Tax=Maridesulfovibrio hydrothermalis AM13 = DSM 14728 TaxID=1121451 RepID=L0RA27_9BACT|nr:FecR domain-containing protein [Maridesulfovibrio hydrothermalis]CCO22401.1 conserved protein of unknown function [Maridesulfovibrio hydrothermalis AM13 = DSM 14728]
MSPEANELGSIGVILAANGEVFLRSDSGLRGVESGAIVYKGEELVTGPDSNAEIRFADDTLLSQGADSSIALDDYIFDESDESSSALLFKMSQGTFRMVTGKIAEQNPDRFHIGTPLATIGIRGTTTVHEISPDGAEKHGVEEIHSGKALLIQSIDGGVRLIDSPQALIDIAVSGQMSTVRTMTVQEFESFREIAPSAIQQEQEIREEQQQEDQQDDPQEDQQEAGEDAEGEQQDDGEEAQDGDVQEAAAQGADGGETGLQQLAGEAGVGVFLDSGLDGEGGDGALPGALLGLAQEVFDALADGNVELAQEGLEQLENITTADDILELIEAGTDTEIPPEGEGQTYSSGDGTNWILGTSGNDVWAGSENTDYYKGLPGDDVINGRCGNDVLHGDEGDDTIEGGNGSDTIDGGSGFDFLSFETESYSHGVDVYLGGNSATVAGGAEADIDTFVNIEGVIGSSLGDTISGSSADNTLLGGDGNDVISAIGGNNVLNGESGNDILYGASGSDTLIGGHGADTLYSGAGNTDFTYLQSSDFSSSEAVFNFSHTDDMFKFNSEFFGTVKNYETYAEYGTSSATDPVFVWDSGTDKLYWDSDGAGGAAPLEQIAVVSGDDVLASDIDLVVLS